MAKQFYRNQRDRDGSCSEMGESAENLFVKGGESRGYHVLAAHKKLQFDKVDFILTKDNKTIKVEVKARKRISRQDSSAQDELLWVELSNVSAKEGKNGWLYGKADVIAFEQADRFVLVNREELAKYVETVCDLETFVAKPKDALYKSYRRFDRPQEHLSIIVFSKMLDNVKHTVWSKTPEMEKGYYVEFKSVKNGPWNVLNKKPFNSFEEAMGKLREIEANNAETVVKVR